MNKIKITTDVLINKNIKKEITIIHIADIHFNINTPKKQLERLQKTITEKNPDYIMITGDILDTAEISKNSPKIKELLIFLTGLAKQSKVLISLGNHDVLTEEDHKFFNKLNDLYNIYVLDNKNYKDEFISVTGYTLPVSYYYNITGNESIKVLLSYLESQKHIDDISSNKIFKIALIHSPINLTDNSVINMLENYDLILSGHTHNGMVLPILNFLFKKNYGFIAPNKKLIPKIAKGKIEQKIHNKKISIIINGGITKLSPHSSKILNIFNFLYNKDINKIIIRKKEI